MLAACRQALGFVLERVRKYGSPLAGMNGVPARGALLGRKPGLDLAITVYAPFSWKISLLHQYILIANHQRYGANSMISIISHRP